MKKLFAFVFAAALTGLYAAGTECRISENIIDKVAVYTLDNGVLQVKCIPEASGLISGIYSIPEKREMIAPVRYKVIVDDLMPRRFSVKGHSGVKELAGGVKMEFFNDYRVRKKESSAEKCVLELYSRSYYARDISVVKKITVKRGEALLKVSIDFTAHSTLDKAFLFWLNAIGSMGKERDVVLIPVDGNIKTRSGKGLSEINGKRGIFVDDLPDIHNIYLAPTAPWMARYSKGRAGIQTVVFRKGGDDVVNKGYFSTWKHAQSPLHTIEMYFDKRQLKKGDVWNLEYDTLYFAGLRSLRAVAGNYGIDREGNTLLIASAAPVAPGVLKLQSGNGAAEVKLPELTPGKVFKVDLEKLMGKVPSTLTAVLPGDVTCEIPEQISL